MILSSISHIATAQDCFCLEKNRFLFRLRTAKGDIAKVVLHSQDKYLPLSYKDTREEKEMTLLCSDHTLDYWEAELSFDVICLRYWFEIIDKEGNVAYFANRRFLDTAPTLTDEMFDCPQNMREEAVFITPAWAENKVIYQIFPSRFATSKNVPDELWYKSPVGSFDDLGGDIKGITEHLEHIRDLGADIVYMTPIFRSNSSHKYDTIDYYSIDPSFGTKEDIIGLVDKAHSLGLKVILDAVFNHSGRDFFAFKDVREKGENSEYLDWYFIDELPIKDNYEGTPGYKTFGYTHHMPKLNLKNPTVAEYFTDVALYWLRECHIDGWRLDVADEIAHSLWKQFRKRIKAEFPEALIIGEIWHIAEDFLQGDEWDTVMNYPFYDAVLRLSKKNSVTGFSEDMSFLKGNLHPKVLPLLWNLIDSHDTPRLLNQCAGDKRKMKMVSAIQLLQPGMPMIYYGDEFAMQGAADPDCRRGMLWKEEYQDRDMFRWYQSLLKLRKEYPELLSRDAKEITDEENGIIIRHAGKRTVVFHCKDGKITLPEFNGKTDMITEKVCDGTFAGYEVKIF
ncbi:MAG: alpha amylase N-terminal ig-like domain-containing protein [Clostridia bacterium]|nr:alpha amylase N-terminal ig-like domain-containing protein [Clostridia bacterium]